MSGAGAGNRNKSKKQRSSVSSDDPQSLILRGISQKNQVDQDDIFYLYHLNKPICQGCRVNSKDSPNCFCGLIPPPGGSRKHGLWQKTSETQAEWGPDPNGTLRPNMDSPAGLTNLGATCYVNSVLQCLYRIKPFIRGFFAAEAELIQRQYVLRELALLFGQLHSGKTKAVDSAHLADVLELNNSIQQDGQEFLKLLLTSLEGLLGLSKNLQARSVVQDVFRGTLSHVTRCSKCGQESDASKQLVDFYELELNVKGLVSLDESLDDYLSEEQLLGENQFFCEACNTRVDATHCSKLRSLPPVLNFQLKRFIFDAKTATKKKVTSKFSFPSILNMCSRLTVDCNRDGIQAEESLLYDLSAILIHKGSTANSGHYVANIRDDQTGIWWEFDDELVTRLGFHPFGEVGASCKKDMDCKEIQMRPGKQHGCQDPSDDADALQLSETKVQSEEPNRHIDWLTSADAYMLIYNLRECTGLCNGSKVSPWQTSKVEQINVFNIEGQSGLLLPDYLQHEIDEQNAELLGQCTNYNLKLEKELLHVTNRRNEVRSVLAEAPVKSQGDAYFWISTSWLRSWADDPIPCPIDNSQLLCEHGKVPMTMVNLMKRISKEAWAYLQTKYEGGPALSEKYFCIDCIMEHARTVASASSFRDQRMKVRQMLEDAAGSADFGGEYYFVSRTWLQNWLRRKSADAPTEADALPTASITCPHGSLLPDNTPGAKRQPVPEDVWNYFLQVAMQLGESLNGCLSFSVSTPTCAVCEAQIMQVASQQQDLRAIKMEQRHRHESLFSGDSISIVPGVTYYLLPSEWLARWRSYLGGSSKRSVKVDEPLGLEGIIQALLCQKHQNLLFRPPKLQRNRRGELVQGMGHDEIFTVVSQDDWTDLCGRWDVNLCLSIKAVVEPSNQLHASNMAEGLTSEHFLLDGVSEVQKEEDQIPCLITTPEVCKECIEERENSELMQKLQYVGEEIYVDLVCGKDPPKSVIESSKGERRVSKRPRRGSGSTNRRFVLRVSGDTTLYQLKLLIWESSAVVKDNQRVHFGTKELNDDSATLADLSILPGAHLWVADTGLHENRDIAEELFTQADPVGVEEGFSGTLLARLPILAESFSLEGGDTSCQIDGDPYTQHQACVESYSLDGMNEVNGKPHCNGMELNQAADFVDASPSSTATAEDVSGEDEDHSMLIDEETKSLSVVTEQKSCTEESMRKEGEQVGFVDASSVPT